ncbi:hypothetical protein AAG570_010595 [Ranatra chinensis]|uniref:SUEL-type lectin domain-containing protein n=1 Tax=Ranatra chinensis TaxID=642074 RepID=A0ABD0Z538_9HEMI
MSSCAVIASNGIFGDPCGGTVKYLEVAYRCIYGDKRRVVGCENSHIEISCGAGEVVELEEVLYGRTNAATCNRHPILTNSCGTPAAKGVLQKACNGMSSCSVPATNGVFGDPCVGTVKYLDVTYKCRKGKVHITIQFVLAYKTLYYKIISLMSIKINFGRVSRHL